MVQTELPNYHRYFIQHICYSIGLLHDAVGHLLCLEQPRRAVPLRNVGEPNARVAAMPRIRVRRHRHLVFARWQPVTVALQPETIQASSRLLGFACMSS